ncbi:MAG: dipicolinate synthase subunit B [Oscillospiraceae bacterium]|nr:dipicolinate synthase subunit B [Oscillospiraceae bacterium]
MKGKTVGFALTGSFCTYDKIFAEIEKVMQAGAKVVPIMSEVSLATDTRFGNGYDVAGKLEELTGNKVIATIKDAEPIGPKGLLDILVIAPCTGNTIAKLSTAIADGCVTMAAKAHLRNNKPLLLGISTNDGLGGNAKNIGVLLARKNIFFVPFGQDDPENKCNSLIFKPDMIVPAMEEALEFKQIQPILV